MITQTLRFAPMRARRRHVFTCQVCGKRAARERTFEKTVNPFNRHADGTVRTAAEVQALVDAEADAWAPTRHEKCEE